ncbi:MAG: DUF3775 domain-containing protein [Clostridium celatum]|nr:DUF3775 domain-containing protein [Clostridium celatum]
MRDLNEIKHIVNETIKKSDEFHKFLSKNKFKSDIKNNPGYTEDELKERRKLSEYLESFDDDTVLTIQAIMYLGRDGDYSNESEVEAIISAKKKELGFATKEIEVNQMVSKAPLSDYLKAGLKLLGL